MSEFDFRESAYLKAENWPEAIPWIGPKREYGPYPWGSKTHYDPHDLDNYPSGHPDAASIGGVYPGDVCPSCGVPLKNNETVRNQSGREGIIWDLAQDSVGVPLYHPECGKEREAQENSIENQSLTDFQ